MSERDDVDIAIEGNDSIGYVVKIDGEIKDQTNSDQIQNQYYDLDQIKADVAQWILENDYEIGSEHKDGDVKVWSICKASSGRKLSRYREVTVVLDENPLIEDPDYIAGMSRMPQSTREDAGLRVYEGRGVGHFGKEDLLFNIIVTDRQTDLGAITFVIEEGQSDWQNDIRRAGGTRDPKQYMEVFDRLEALEAEILTYESKVLGGALGQVIDAVQAEADRRISGPMLAQLPQDGDFHSEVLLRNEFYTMPTH